LNLATIILDHFFSFKWTILAPFRAIDSDKSWYITNFYGPLTSLEKPTFLKNLKYIKDIIQDHRWILGGDFNLILSLKGKMGDIRRLEK
jgi:hypothetical protein